MPYLPPLSLIHICLLGLISFLTAGEDECRAWTIKEGTKAPQAAGKIHTDFERGFIKAEVVNYQDLQGIGMTGKLALPTLIALCSIALGRPVQSSTAILGEISISGTLIKVDNLADRCV